MIRLKIFRWFSLITTVKQNFLQKYLFNVDASDYHQTAWKANPAYFGFLYCINTSNSDKKFLIFFKYSRQTSPILS